MSIAQTVCAFVALGIQHAMRMRRIVITVLPRSTYFPTLSHKRHNFWGEKMLLNIKLCVLVSLQLLFQTFLIIRRNERDMIKQNVYRSSCKVPVILVRF